MLAVLGAFSIGVTVAIVNSLIGAVIFGSLSGWRISGRTRRAFSLTRPASDPPIEPERETGRRALYQVLIITVLLLIVNLAFRNAGTDAGIGIGAGVGMIVAASDLKNLEDQKQTRLLRVAPSGYGLTLRWRSQPLDPNRYRLTSAGDWE